MRVCPVGLATAESHCLKPRLPPAAAQDLKWVEGHACNGGKGSYAGVGSGLVESATQQCA